MDVLIKIQRTFDLYNVMTLILILGMYLWGFPLFSAINAFLLFEILLLMVILRMRTKDAMQGKVPFKSSGLEELALAPLYVLIGYGFMEYVNTKHWWQFLLCLSFVLLMYIVAMRMVYAGKEEKKEETHLKQPEGREKANEYPKDAKFNSQSN